MKTQVFLFALLFGCIPLTAQKSGSPLKNHLQKSYLELDIGALAFYSFGANVNVGYQFKPYLGLGVSASVYSELNDYFPANWTGRGLHYRGTFKNFILRADWNTATNIGRNDDRGGCGGLEHNMDKKSRYQSFSIGYRHNSFRLSINVSNSNLHFIQHCDDEYLEDVYRYQQRAIAIVPMIGFILGDNRKKDKL